MEGGSENSLFLEGMIFDSVAWLCVLCVVISISICI